MTRRKDCGGYWLVSHQKLLPFSPGHTARLHFPVSFMDRHGPVSVLTNETWHPLLPGLVHLALDSWPYMAFAFQLARLEMTRTTLRVMTWRWSSHGIEETCLPETCGERPPSRSDCIVLLSEQNKYSLNILSSRGLGVYLLQSLMYAQQREQHRQR